MVNYDVEVSPEYPARRESRSRVLAMKRLTFAILMLGLPMSLPPQATVGPQTPGPQSVRTLTRMIERSCGQCHQAPQRAGGLDLAELSADFSNAAMRARWIELYDRVERREMPPPGISFGEEKRLTLLRLLGLAIAEADRRDVLANGRGPLRRLNRDEYEQNLRDLLRLPNLDIRDKLPEDRESHHHNKVAETLDMSRIQLAAYLDAAEVALNEARSQGVGPPTVTVQRAEGEQLSVGRETTGGREAMFWVRNGQAIDLGAEKRAATDKTRRDRTISMALFRSPGWPYGIFPQGIVARTAGQYRVRFAARARHQFEGFTLCPATAPVPMTFRSRRPTNHDIAEDVRSTGGMIDVTPAGGIYETTVHLVAGQTIEYGLLGLPAPQPDVKGVTAAYRYPPFPTGGQPGIVFDWLELEGPLPPSVWPSPSHRVLFDHHGAEVRTERPEAEARRLLRRFIRLAAREPIGEDSIAGFEKLVLHRLAAGESLTESLLAGYQAFLASDLFIYLREPREEGDHHAIASRLSHLLTDSRPDDTLLALAAQRRLRESSVLEREARRLITSDNFDRFVNHFTNYWLNLRALRRDDPDIRLFPEYRLDDYLVESLGLETRTFFTAMVRQNLPASTLIDSDFTFANDRLARHYGLAPIVGSAMRRVDLPPGSPYGGLLTQGALLKVSANGVSTSPVLRGVWVADRLLGQPPPPPPPGIPAVEPDIRGAQTIRETLALHTRSASCAGCHAKFDSFGIALESFDVLGAWRTRYRGLERGERVSGIDQTGHDFSYTLAAPVDSAGQLADGRQFRDVHDLKRLLVANPRQLARNLLRQFTVYATGVPVRFSDRAEIEAILDANANSGYRVQDLLLGLIRSRIFLGPKGSR